MSSPRPLRVELITLGEELLLGLTPNSHLTWLGDQFARRGVQVERAVTIADDAPAIARQFRESWERADLLITTGGLGPTVDDRTREVIAEALGQELVPDPATLARIEEIFVRIKRPMTDNNRRQACRPRDAEFIVNDHGTAPGIWFERDGRVLVMLPGPPPELIPMWERRVLPRLEERGLLAPREVFVQVRTAGIGESALETKLLPLLAGWPGVAIAFCAHQGNVDFRLAAPGGAHDLGALHGLARECAALLGPDCYTIGRAALAEVVIERLVARRQTLAVAESCTGGLLAHTLTDVPGASRVLVGGTVAYTADAKRSALDVPAALIEQHSAVSAEVAMAMATGAAERLGADFALATTGYAGPGGGTAADPVGTVYLGLQSPTGLRAKRIFYPGVRSAVKLRATTSALDWLRRALAEG